MVDLRKGDSNELLKSIPDKSIDLVIIDPPYKFGSGAFGSDKRNYHKECISLYKETGRSNVTANANRLMQNLRLMSGGGINVSA